MPPDCVGRFLCTKFTWRGKYPRVLCITPSTVVTQHPDNLAITNTWTFIGDPDIDSVSVGPGPLEFSLSARKDSRVSQSQPFASWQLQDPMLTLPLDMQSKYKATKFACEQRGPLLTALYQCMASAAVLGQCGVAAKILG